MVDMDMVDTMVDLDMADTMAEDIMVVDMDMVSMMDITQDLAEADRAEAHLATEQEAVEDLA